MNTRSWPLLVRREFWEHRVLWIAPLIVAALYILVCFIPGAINFSGLQPGPAIGPDSRAIAFFLSVQLMFTLLLYALASVVIFFYLADCLYAERKDRSILFWKSLPVSDSATVLTKVLVASLVVPLGLFLLSIVTNVLAFGVLYAQLHNNPVLSRFVQWDTSAWLHMNAVLLMDVLILALWFAPVVTYQLLVSAWAKGSVLVWTLFPPLALMLGERVTFGTSHIGSVLVQRLGINLSGVMRETPRVASGGAEGLLQKFDLFGLLLTPDLWIGVVIAAAMVFGTIRIRRYRDDT